MAQAVEIQWISPPSNLQAAIAQYGAKVLFAVKAIADYIATEAQNDMRKNASWTDRTGNARSGLFSYAEIAAKDIVTIYLSHGHTIYYGIFLEAGYGGRYAIIVPTMQRIMPKLERMLQNLFR